MKRLVRFEELSTNCIINFQEIMQESIHVQFAFGCFIMFFKHNVF